MPRGEMEGAMEKRTMQLRRAGIALLIAAVVLAGCDTVTGSPNEPSPAPPTSALPAATGVPAEPAPSYPAPAGTVSPYPAP